MKEQLSVACNSGLCCSRSTLLVPEYYLNRYIERKKIDIACFLRLLLGDPECEYKLRFLKSKKWRKQYQEEGQNLVRLNFYPHEGDWAKLSLLSNATGFSRCYIFVYLMLLYLGVLFLSNGGTPPKIPQRKWNPIIKCAIILDLRLRKLTRKLQT